MSKHASPAIVGTFVVAAVVLAIAGVMVFGGERYFHKSATVVVYFESSVVGLRVGAPVRFRGIEIGSVKDIRINLTGVARDPRHVRIPVLLSIDEDRLHAQGLPRQDLGKPGVVAKLVALGLRAQLETESMLTGVRYIAIDILPDSPANLVHDPTYPEVPSLPSPGQAIPQKLDRILANLAELDVAGISDSLQRTLHDADHLVTTTDRLVASPHLTRTLAHLDTITDELSTSVRDLRPTLAELHATAAAARQTLAVHIDAAVRQLEATARSVRRLTDQLSRDPGSLLRGGRP